MLKQLDTLIGFAVVMSIVSMLIMVVTQAVSSLLALRGKNLRSGLEALFFTLVPNLPAGQARDLAEVILKRPIISDSSLSLKGSMPEAWKLASAIRPEECLLAIKRIASSSPQELAKPLSKKAQGAVAGAQEAAASVLKAVKALTPNPDQTSVLASITALAPGHPDLPNIAAQVTGLAEHAAVAVNDEAQKWKSRFQAAQDRSDQWFTMHARRVTVTLAFIAAFLLQLNAFDLYERLANDPTLRNELLKRSPEIQKSVDAAVQNMTPEVLQDKDKAAAEAARLKEVVGFYDQTTVHLIPDKYPDFPGGFLGLTGAGAGKAFFGMLATGVLLTLGAPFWFNLLKSLASLRSAVSEQMDKEDEAKSA